MCRYGRYIRFDTRVQLVVSHLRVNNDLSCLFSIPVAEMLSASNKL
jgi:hypothetical protein